MTFQPKDENSIYGDEWYALDRVRGEQELEAAKPMRWG